MTTLFHITSSNVLMMLDFLLFQAIELVFQQELGPVQAGFIGNLAKTSVIEKGQVTASTALKELRKISNLLSEM